MSCRFQVAPAELEGLLNSIEGVADAGVTGIFVEAEQTEYPKAYVVPSTPALLQHLSIAAEGRYEGKPHADLVAFVKGINAFIEQKTSHYKR
jgi:acyl-coenzyme A synthetase/AMP-(fatty) acid ligase